LWENDEVNNEGSQSPTRGLKSRDGLDRATIFLKLTPATETRAVGYEETVCGCVTIEEGKTARGSRSTRLYARLARYTKVSISRRRAQSGSYK
jgi:hypothetical protein